MALEQRLIGGRYRIVRKIAEGGMGEVYEAQHNLSKKAVALKILFPHIGKDEAARQRFLREVSAPAQIGHDGIVEVYDAGFDPEDGALFVAMELLIGEPLRERLARGGIPLDTLLDYFEQILIPLAAAHDKGIVHRDLKPENVFLTTKRDGTEVLKLLDFGIARDLDSSQTNVTHTGIAMGTPHYMAPEQAMSAKGVTAGADVWALGVMLYEALAGRTPFDGETASAIVVHACTRAHTPLWQLSPSVPRPLADFVDRCLQKSPEHRPLTGAQMLQELRQVRQMIGSVSSMQAGSSFGGAQSGVAPLGTGPFGQQQHSQHSAPGGYTPKGTAVIPQQHTGQGAFGQPMQSGGAFGQPMNSGGYGTPVGAGYMTPPPGGSPAPVGGAFGAPNSSGGGFGTPNPSGFGSQPGYVTGAPSGPGGFGAPGGYSQPKPSGGGMAIGVIAAVLIGGLVIVGGGIAVAVMLLSDDDEPNGPVVVATTGTIRVQTDIAAGELFVDGTSRGPVTPGQQFAIEAGSHTVEIRESGLSAASSTVVVTAGQDAPVTLNRALRPNPDPPPPQNTQTFNGALAVGDERLRTGEYADNYYFDWQAGGVVHIEAIGSGLDTYLILKAPSGAQQDNDDGGGSLNAMIDATLGETGRWQVIVTSFQSGMTGNYQLVVRGP